MAKIVSNKKNKLRADILLVNQGLTDSRSRAQALILGGKVFAGDRRVEKAGETLSVNVELKIRGYDHPWVSRGGLKLDHAINKFNLDVSGNVCLDIGASTGGFTDVLLTRGANRVYAIDVGHGQLAWKLRNHERVIVLERTNARYLTLKEIPEQLDLIVCDASFISLETILPAALKLIKPESKLLALIKPQFEVGKGQVGKKGVVRDPALHQLVCDRIQTWINSLISWKVMGIIESPIKGPEGNIEFLILANHG
jgi:23S rRNA (cytidine1920-2'-O)/16S rRNA (cytidine1409-2'-O)-methyltransferase|tara:strand:- start:153 stop:914 length:762 start_codon:yes stop_codon:yes gene_type:complete